MNYWTFKHKPGGDGGAIAKEFVEKAIKLNSAIMQYEYGQQTQSMVTQNWNRIRDVEEGDYVFLRGDNDVYAVGQVIKPRRLADVTLSMGKILKNKSHGKYISGEYDGCVHFDDCPIFYEDLSDGFDGWGQRIDVESWKFYTPQGIYVKDQSNYIDNESEFGVLKQLKIRKGVELLEKLKNGFMNNEIQLLEKGKNIILTGAPGTGKTYLARQMAMKMLFGKNLESLLSVEEKKVFKEQFCFVQFHPSYDYSDFVEGLRPIKRGDILGFELRNGIFKEFCKNAFLNASKKYFFVIDEINRGDLSKIFGELFFSIDPGYRGENGKVKTQYANIQTDDTIFSDEHEPGDFFIPDNVYIIGTMNDIDRSVESFDFAMRRRFTWVEINPRDRMSMWDGCNYIDKKEAEKKMTALNNVICATEELGEHFQIGPAYFLKLEEHEGDYEKLWRFNIEPLLKEYLRGTSDMKGSLVKMEKAYAPN
jgi:5-methylcytosine-specific restriction endonuclease McrBC GTP-binding regulatory subunit McrB